jgi:DNA-binding XRE family transcriptional regulator
VVPRVCFYSSQDVGLEAFFHFIEGDVTMSNQTANHLMDIAKRIRDMREILGYSMQKMAELTEVSTDTYKLYESGTIDLSVDDKRAYFSPN